eukprot:m.293199 g.293199  ORF g.293199 m.293199 type:complete len:526 (-) comp19491_c0_seq3:693-2270(-)
MFNPQMMQQAQQMFGNMTPEQRRSMQNMVAGMDPSVLANMSQQMGMPAATPEQIRLAQQQAQTMDPEQLASAATAAGPQAAAHSEYLLAGARQLKEQGNSHHRQGKYTEAIQCYERAFNNLEAHTTPDAVALRRACQLNTASCFLKLDQPDRVIDICSAVIASGAESMKAFYRRAVAYEKKNQFNEALADLRQAAVLAPEDPTIPRAIARVQAALGAEGTASSEQADPSPERAASSVEPEQQHPQEPVSPTPASPATAAKAATPAAEPKSTPAAAPPRERTRGGAVAPATVSASSTTPDSTATPASATVMGHTITEDMVESMQQTVRANPAMFRSQQRQILAMSDAALQQMGVDPAMARMQAQMVETMSDEQIVEMMERVPAKDTVRRAREAQSAVAPAPTASASAAPAPSQAGGGQVAASSAATPAASSIGSSPPGMPNLTPELMEQAQAMARSNPGWSTCCQRNNYSVPRARTSATFAVVSSTYRQPVPLCLPSCGFRSTDQTTTGSGSGNVRRPIACDGCAA